MQGDESSEDVKDQSQKKGKDVESFNSPVPPDKPGTLHAGSVTAKPVKNQVQELEDRIKRAEKWMIILTGAIAFFGLCQVVAAFLQWDAMKGQLVEMRGSSNQSERLVILNTGQLKANAKLADAADRTATYTKDVSEKALDQSKATNRLAKSSEATVAVARDNLKLAESSLEVQQRPWVGVLGVNGSFENGVMKCVATLKNYGKSPAFHVTYHSSWSAEQPIVNFGYVFQHVDSRSVLMPDELLVGAESTAEPTIIGIARIEQGLGHAYFFGEVTYEDMFSYQAPYPVLHMTHFCGFWDLKTKQFLNCPTYNDAN
jgi:hypothetical protein